MLLDYKGRVSVVVDAAAIPLAFVSPWIAGLSYVFVALIWFVSDRRVEKTLVE